MCLGLKCVKYNEVTKVEIQCQDDIICRRIFRPPSSYIGCPWVLHSLWLKLLPRSKGAKQGPSIEPIGVQDQSLLYWDLGHALLVANIEMAAILWVLGYLSNPKIILDTNFGTKCLLLYRSVTVRLQLEVLQCQSDDSNIVFRCRTKLAGESSNWNSLQETEKQTCPKKTKRLNIWNCFDQTYQRFLDWNK